MDTKPDDRSAEMFGDSGVIATPVTSRSAPSNANGEPDVEYKAAGLWQSGAKALSRSWDEARIGWMRLTSWSRGKVGMDDGSPSTRPAPTPPKRNVD